MTHVIERLTVRNSVDLLDALGRPVTASVTMHVRGGGLFHAIVVGAEQPVAVYWGRNENKFLTLDLDRRDLDNAEREWETPQGRNAIVNAHNVMCSCSECLQRQLRPAHALAGPVEPVEIDLPPGKWPATAHVLGGGTADIAPEAMQIADNALVLSALAERVRVLEAEVNALRARLDARGAP